MKIKMLKNKSYNPFKMWGSYVGGVIGLMAYFLLGYLNPIAILISAFIPNEQQLSQLLGDSGIIFILFSILVSNIIIGFLIGWGIHSLIRKLE